MFLKPLMIATAIAGGLVMATPAFACDRCNSYGHRGRPLIDVDAQVGQRGHRGPAIDVDARVGGGHRNSVLDLNANVGGRKSLLDVDANAGGRRNSILDLNANVGGRRGLLDLDASIGSGGVGH